MENHASSVHSGDVSPRKVGNKSNLLLALGAVAVIVIVLLAVNFGGNMFGNAGKKLSPDEARAKALNFINTTLVSGTTAEITEVTDYSDSLYKLKVKVGTSDIESYITKDGLTFFPQAMPIDGSATADAGATPAAQAPVAAADIPKEDTPKVEVFVMSHCPYGTQIEKGLVPVMETLGKKADIQIKYVNYLMHGLVEKDDNMKQYCIGQEEPTKYTAYLKCFLQAGNSDSCITSTGLNSGKISSCVKELDSKYKITESFNDKTKWANGSFPPFPVQEADNQKYGVQGSPTFIINGKTVETDRSPAGLLATVCAGFKDKPKECDAKLDTATPGPGFGTAAAATDASNAACAPVAS